jgi:hypothetical protein
MFLGSPSSVWLIFDILCVAIGVLVLGIIERPAYDIKVEMHRAKMGLCDFSNWREALVGFVVVLFVWAVGWLLWTVF